VLHKPEIPSEYQTLIKQWERSMNKTHATSYKADPLAEYERLFKLWERTQNKIAKTTFILKKE